MRIKRFSRSFVMGAVAAGAAFAASDARSFAAGKQVYDFVAVTKGNDLIHFRSDAPSTITHRVKITGTFESNITTRQITQLAVRPSTKQLYAMDNGHLYVIDPWTGQATWSSGWIGAGTNQLDTKEGSPYGSMDFEPGSGYLRVLDSRGLTFRIDPGTGALVDADPATPGNQPDRDRLYFVDGDAQVRDINPATRGFAFDPTHPGTAYTIHGHTSTFGWNSIVRIDGFGALRSSDKTISTVGPQYIPGGGLGDCIDLLEIASDGVAWRIAQRVNASGAFLSRVNLTTGAVTPVPIGATGDTGTEILYDLNITAFCISPDWKPSETPAPPLPPLPEPPVAVPPPPPPPPSLPATLNRVAVDVDLTKPAHDDVTLVGSAPFDGGTLAGAPVDVAVGDAARTFVLGRKRAARDGDSSVRVSRVHRGRVRFRIRLSPADLADEVGLAATGDGAPLPVTLTLDGTRYSADVTLTVRQHGSRRLVARARRP